MQHMETYQTHRDHPGKINNTILNNYFSAPSGDGSAQHGCSEQAIIRSAVACGRYHANGTASQTSAAWSSTICGPCRLFAGGSADITCAGLWPAGLSVLIGRVNIGNTINRRVSFRAFTVIVPERISLIGMQLVSWVMGDTTDVDVRGGHEHSSILDIIILMHSLYVPMND